MISGIIGDALIMKAIEGLRLAIALEIGWCKITTSIIFFLGLPP
jgi:hypothetical protein